MALKFSTEFITKFISDNGDESLQQKWTAEVPKFKKLFKKAELKSVSKDDNVPKKNKSAYNIYCSENISIIKEELPSLDNKAIFSEMAKRWKKVKDTEDFNKYEILAKQDKERYTQEKNEFTKDIKPLGPKKAKTGYMLFCDEERTKILNIKGKELLIELGKRWQILKKNKDKRLQAYQKLAQEDKERYTAEKFAILKNGNDDVVVESVVIEPVVIEPVVIEPVVVEPVVVEPVKKKGGKKPVKK